ncbi:MAG TPA: DNA polymerase III subunit gamma/tau [Desulfobacteraceae bacterium]|nr:DNA polymerase III subunit gamma/tau [Desulfobacteraceae bacterium]
MSYQVLALKYRPQTFEDVVGQDHVTTTLTNAIAADRVAHAILLTGPRGTGKTTIARILAKAMTCAQGPTAVPCNACKICTDIINGHCADVFEIDGASNNSVEQIRDLRENVTYMPSSARFKIYIIDEVHMLSVAAFNALLKTLEEPPAHVLFIFATTEVHKIPATILSRCQRHDLSRVPLNQIAGHLNSLCSKEAFSISRESLDLIALEADGSIRDSLSLLDRVLSSSPDKTISHEAVVDSLGVMDRKIMSDISNAVFNKDGASLIRLVDKVNDSGMDLKKFYTDIIAHFRNLNIVKLCGRGAPALNLIDSEKEALFQSVAKIPQAYLSLLLQRLLDDDALVRLSSHTQTAVEMVLLKLIQINSGAQLDDIITKLDTLARQIDTKVTANPGVPNSPSIPSDTRSQPPASPEIRESGPPQTPGPKAPQKASQYSNPVPPASAQASPPDMQVPPQGIQEPPPAAPYADAPAPPAGPPPRGANAPAPAPQPSVPESPLGPVSWTEFLGILQEKQPSLYTLLSKGRADTSDKTKVSIELNGCSAFESKRLKTKDKELQALSRTHLGKPINIIMTTQKGTAPAPSQKRKAEEQARQAASMHPMVQEARRLFDGEIIL